MEMHFLFLCEFLEERFRDLLTNVPKECLFTYFSSALCGRRARRCEEETGFFN
jgi:hypothetical protein